MRAQLDAVAPVLSKGLKLDRDVLERWADFDARIEIVDHRPDVQKAFDFHASGPKGERPERPAAHFTSGLHRLGIGEPDRPVAVETMMLGCRPTSIWSEPVNERWRPLGVNVPALQ